MSEDKEKKEEERKQMIEEALEILEILNGLPEYIPNNITFIGGFNLFIKKQKKGWEAYYESTETEVKESYGKTYHTNVYLAHVLGEDLFEVLKSLKSKIDSIDTSMPEPDFEEDEEENNEEEEDELQQED